MGRRLAGALAAALLLAGCGDSGDAPEVADDAATTPTTSETAEPGPSSSPEATEAEAASGGVRDPDRALWFYPPAEGATLTFIQTVNGETTSITGTVTSVDDGQVDVTEDVDGLDVERRFVTGDDGGTLLDPGGFFASADDFRVTAAGDSMAFLPLDEFEAGATSSGSTFVEYSGSGFTGRNDVTYEVVGAGFEEVTVPAGTFEAYKVVVSMDVTTDRGMNVAGTASYWFVPGFAVVRSVFDVGQVVTLELASSSV